jgi:hypothetical protein
MTWVRTDWPKSGTYAIEAPAAISTDGINSFKFNDHLLVRSASAPFRRGFWSTPHAHNPTPKHRSVQVSGGYAEVTMSNYDV